MMQFTGCLPMCLVLQRNVGHFCFNIFSSFSKYRNKYYPDKTEKCYPKYSFTSLNAAYRVAFGYARPFEKSLFFIHIKDQRI